MVSIFLQSEKHADSSHKPRSNWRSSKTWHWEQVDNSRRQNQIAQYNLDILAKRGAITFCTRLTRATDLIKVRCTLPWTRVLKDWRHCRNIKGAVLEQACQNLVLSWRTLRASGNYTQFIYPDRAGLIKARCALIILCRSALGQVVSCVAHHSRAHRTLSGTIGAIQVIAAVAGPLAIVGIVRIARAYEICIGNRCTC